MRSTNFERGCSTAEAEAHGPEPGPVLSRTRRKRSCHKFCAKKWPNVLQVGAEDRRGQAPCPPPQPPDDILQSGQSPKPFLEPSSTPAAHGPLRGHTSGQPFLWRGSAFDSAPVGQTPDTDHHPPLTSTAFPFLSPLLPPPFAFCPGAGVSSYRPSGYWLIWICTGQHRGSVFEAFHCFIILLCFVVSVLLCC